MKSHHMSVRMRWSSMRKTKQVSTDTKRMADPRLPIQAVAHERCNFLTPSGARTAHEEGWHLITTCAPNLKTGQCMTNTWIASWSRWQSRRDPHRRCTTKKWKTNEQVCGYKNSSVFPSDVVSLVQEHHQVGPRVVNPMYDSTSWQCQGGPDHIYKALTYVRCSSRNGVIERPTRSETSRPLERSFMVGGVCFRFC